MPLIIRTDFCIKPHRLGRRGKKRRFVQGEYMPGTGLAWVNLPECNRAIPPGIRGRRRERLLIEEVVVTIAHETLHPLVNSSGPKKWERDHEAIRRLLNAAGFRD